MDSASILATFPPELRDEVLLTSDESVLASLPPALLAEARTLRENAVAQYRASHQPPPPPGGGVLPDSIAGINPPALGSLLRINEDGLGELPRSITRWFNPGPGGSQRRGAPLERRARDVEGKPMLDDDTLVTLVRLLRMAQPLAKGLVQRLLLNLCAYDASRRSLVRRLLAPLRGAMPGEDLTRLYGCKAEMVYHRGTNADGRGEQQLPPLVSRRTLEVVTFLARNHPLVAELLVVQAVPDSTAAADIKGKGKAAECGHAADEIRALHLLLDLLNADVYTQSETHLESLLQLLQAVLTYEKVDTPSPRAPDGDGDAPEQEGAETAAAEASPAPPATQSGAGASVEGALKPPADESVAKPAEKASAAQEEAKLVIGEVRDEQLTRLACLLGRDGLSSNACTSCTTVLLALVTAAPGHCETVVGALSTEARRQVEEANKGLIATIESKAAHHTAPGPTAAAGPAVLRILKTTVQLAGVSGEPVDEGAKREPRPELLDPLVDALMPLWDTLSETLSVVEATLPASRNIGASSAPLPPGVNDVLPLVEAFFVLCQCVSDSVQPSSPPAALSHVATSPTAAAVATAQSFSGSTEQGAWAAGCWRFAEKHRRVLNALVRHDPSLLEDSLKLLQKAPRLIDFDNKRQHFRGCIKKLNEEREQRGSLRVHVRRNQVLDDSYQQLHRKSPDELRGRLTVQFQGEEGIDAGGLTREWFSILSREIFNPAYCLFTPCDESGQTFQPNPNSHVNPEHLPYFRFVGRLVAKALYDNQMLDAYFTRSFYKHLLRLPITYEDIEAIDPEYYKNLQWMLSNDITGVLDLTFSAETQYFDTCVLEDLKEDGRNTPVTEENKREYVSLICAHRMTNAIKEQVAAFLEGFEELIPNDLLRIFDAGELELLISGLPEIDVDDLQANTEYTGYSAATPVVRMFWEVVRSLDKEDLARLLQFVTGTSKVPLEGFKALQGISGPQRFQIHRAYGGGARLMSAHTCFNQLDLPEYASIEELRERLTLAIREGSTGFGFG